MSEFIELLYRALDARIGISIRTDDVERTRAKLYTARRESNNPDFEALSFMPSRATPDTHIWVVKKNPSQENPDGSPEE